MGSAKPFVLKVTGSSPDPGETVLNINSSELIFLYDKMTFKLKMKAGWLILCSIGFSHCKKPNGKSFQLSSAAWLIPFVHLAVTVSPTLLLYVSAHPSHHVLLVQRLQSHFLLLGTRSIKFAPAREKQTIGRLPSSLCNREGRPNLAQLY